MNVLVTGGAGFLGTNLCQRLLRERYSVVCLDNLYTGRKENIQDLIGLQNFKFVEADIVNGIDLDDRFDWIFNLACPASPPAYQKNPLYTMKVNVVGIFNICDFALKNGSKVFHTSTSEVYGDPDEIPQHESYTGSVNTTGIRACYDEGKRCVETILSDNRRTKGLEVKIVRVFNTYGPYMSPDDGRVITNFVTQALKGEPITVYGDGSQTRSFCYVDDQIDAWMKFIETDSTVTGPMNIGMPREMTVLEVAQLIIKMTNSSSQIIYKDLPEDDPKKRLPDISFAKQMLNWEPKISLEEGLKKTIAYLKQNI